MRMTALSIAVSLVACSAHSPVAQPDATAPAQVGPSADELCAAAELSRRPDAKVRALLASPDAKVRARAALALGRIGDPDAALELETRLADPAMGEVAAWALGRIPTGEPALLSCLAKGCVSMAAATRALGNGTRSAAALKALVSALPPYGLTMSATGGVRYSPQQLAAFGEAGFALGILARTGGKGRDVEVATVAREALISGLGRYFVLRQDPLALDKGPVSRAGAAYALGRIPRGAEEASGAGSTLETALGGALRDTDPETRALAARAWGKQALPALGLVPLLQDADFRVRVEAARALGTATGGASVMAAALPQAMADLAQPGLASARWAHPLVALLETGGPLGPKGLPEPSRITGPTPASTAAARCAAAEARDRAAHKLAETPRCGAGLEPDLRGKLRTASLATELGSADGASKDVLAQARAALADPEPRVRAAAANNAGAPLAAELRKLLDDTDPYVVADAAGSLAKDPKLAAEAAPDAIRAVQRLAPAREKFAGDPAADALAALAQLLGAAERSAPETSLPALLSLSTAASPFLHRALVDALHALSASPLAVPPPALHLPEEALLGLPGKGPRPRTLRLRTSAGDLLLDLHSADGEAPLTASALAALARRNFYDGLSFHRVVPDFVVQGGDPRGDGDGGPGWALPDEHTPLRFRRGTLGIATAGAETGGSQIFICHSAQPHLDGRYTIVGELREGAETLDGLQVGDTILAATVE